MFVFLLVWSALFAEASHPVVINEIHYNGEPNTAANEFVELYNAGVGPVDLSGWTFSDGITYTFPPATTLPAGGFIVVAERPSSILDQFGITALGPYDGALSGEGERVALSDVSGSLVDEVSFRVEFPWPVGADGAGASMELINPALDNNLGGSWRDVVTPGSGSSVPITLISSADTAWRYRHGTSEASSPIDAWRELAFVEDGSWMTGQTPIGYDDDDDNTVLSTMRNSFSTVYLRHTFTVNPGEIPDALTLHVYVDDGAVVWINGEEVARVSAPSGELSYNAFGINHEASWVDVSINNAASLLVEGQNIIAVHALNQSLTSSDFSIDISLVTVPSGGSAGVAVPTPRETNSVFAANAPPQIRQVDHLPKQPIAGESAVITAKVTDPAGVAAVTLEYQVVAPGAYVPAFLAKTTSDLHEDPTGERVPNPAYHNAANWTSVAMLDDGAGADETKGDGVYTVQLLGQINRALVRYRIRVEDSLGASVRVPYEGDDALNFAYFVYNGVPDYQANTLSTMGAPHTHSAAAIESIPVYHVLTDEADFDQAVGYSTADQVAKDNVEARRAYNWSASFVYEGKVYDNIGYRLRQRNTRYKFNGKRSFKFRFNRGSHPHFRDHAGEKYKRPWAKLSSHKIRLGRDNIVDWGLYQAAAFRLFNEFGAPAPRTHWFHLRVVKGAEEAPSGNDGQYYGDFYGMLLAMEDFGVSFLDEHDLEKGNVYKLLSEQTDGISVRRYLERDSVDDGSDFQNIVFNLRPEQTDEWLTDHVNYDQWYRYQAVKDAVRHYDMKDNTAEHLKNQAYYFKPNATNPLGRLWIFPWDADTCWGPNFNAGWDFPKRAIYDPPRDDFMLEYRNVVRELRDLAWTEEQVGLLIDSLASQIAAAIPSDQDRWIDAPLDAGSQHAPPIEGIVADMKKFAFIGGTWGGGENPTDPNAKDSGISGQQGRDAYLDDLAFDILIPATPQIVVTGPTNFPANELTFQVANYAGVGAFAARTWRLAEIGTTNDFPLGSGEYVKLEINADWESAEITDQNSRDITIPNDVVKVGRTYRVRVRCKDATGRWSHWSAPMEFTCSEPDSATAMLENLKITELMYHAPGGSDFDFVELHNASPVDALDISAAKFTKGIDYTFPPGTVLPPGAYLVLIGSTNEAAFRAHYGLSPSLPIAGPYEGNFSNGGEEVTLRTASGGTDVASFTYNDGRGWPLAADGSGHSLVLRVLGDQTDGSLMYGGNWRASAFMEGSPGAGDLDPVEVVVLNEVGAHTDFPLPPPEDSNDWIELYNPSGNDIVLGSGWYLSDSSDREDLNQWMIPAGTVVPAGGFVSFGEQTDFHSPYPNGFGLNKAGEQLLLSYLPGNDQDRVVDAVRFKGQENGWSLARYPDGAEFWRETETTTHTASNAAAASRPVISEIMYHPTDLTNRVDNKLHEYIEIYNPSASAVNLFNADGTWRLDGEVDYQWPAGSTLSAGGRLLVVGFDPADTTLKAEFEVVYNLQGSSVQLLGPYDGNLANSTGRVALEKPQAPDGPEDSISWVIVDEVIYSDRAPWPQGADGAGPSLHRLDVLESGNNPLAWTAALPTPGGTLASGTLPSITAQPAPASRLVEIDAVVSYSVTATGDNPLFYQWMVDNRLLVGATNQTLVLDPATAADSGTYRVVVFNAAGSVISDPVVLRVAKLPKILFQPLDAAVRPDEPATFSVVCSGEGTLSYAWARNGAAIPGADQASLTIPAVQESDAGSYTVTVSDSNGTVVSVPAELVLLMNPTVLIPPFSQSVLEGNDTMLTVEASGTLPMGYIWRKDGAIVKSEARYAHTSSYKITNAGVSDAGSYTVALTNLAQSAPEVLSSIGTLSVLTDSDGDGMPDTFETAHGFNPNDPSDGALDWDRDGFSNQVEYFVGTDAQDDTSYLRIEGLTVDSLNTGLVRIGFTAVSNRSYSVFMCNELGAEPWTKLADISSAGTNRTTDVVDEPQPDIPSRFYWLVSPETDVLDY